VDRRTVLGGVGGAHFAAPLAAGAQQAAKVWRIGVLMDLYSPNANPPRALRQRLQDRSYLEGRNLVIDWRYQLAQSDRLPALAAELVRLKPDIIVADSTVATRAALQASSTIPIVMAASADAGDITSDSDTAPPDPPRTSRYHSERRVRPHCEARLLLPDLRPSRGGVGVRLKRTRKLAKRR